METKETPNFKEMFGSQVLWLFQPSLTSEPQEQSYVHLPRVFIYQHNFFENATSRLRRKKVAVKLFKKKFARSFSTLGESCHMAFCRMLCQVYCVYT